MNQYEAMFKWDVQQIQLQNKFHKNSQRNAKYHRGAIYTCLFGMNIGHEKSRLAPRPALIVSSNKNNFCSTNVIVVPLSTDIKYRDEQSRNLLYPWHYVLLQENYPKLEKSSVVQCEDIRCVAKVRLGERIGKVSDEDMIEIDKRIKKILDI